ncbi:hypothetical protein [Nocardia panacis]|nr:hypothetical protein [Nocardia panacis]
MVQLALIASTAVGMLRRPKVRDRLDQLAAGIMAVLGIGTAASATL